MAKINVDSKAAFQAGLEKRLKEYADDGEALRKFTRFYFSQIPLSELQHKDWEEVLGSLRSSWAFFREFDGSTPILRVFNPNEKEHGYKLRKTVVELCAQNIPFLVDSIRIELNNQHFVLTDVHHCLLGVVRDGDKFLITEDEHVNETLIHFEVDGVRDTKKLEDEIHEIVRLVVQVVDDFAPMRKRLLLWSDEIGIKSQNENSEPLNEDYELLRWLYNNNYTFLGCEEFVKGPTAKSFRRAPESALGLSRPDMSGDDLPFRPRDTPVAIGKAPIKSRVHRPAYFDTITITQETEDGGIRACRFIGLFTARVYNQSPTEIPVVRKKIDEVFNRSGLSASSHKGREIERIIEVLPREELFLSDSETLSDTVMKIYALQERRIVRVLVHQDVDKNFVSFMVYMPKDAYTTEIRRQVQDLLCSYFDCRDVTFSTYFSESALTRTYFVIRINPKSCHEVDTTEIESKISELIRSWEDDLRDALVREKGEHRGHELFEIFRGVFGPGYEDEFSAEAAVRDIDLILDEMSDENPLGLDFHTVEVGEKISAHFKIINRKTALPLSDVVPILENLGVRVVEEHPYDIHPRDKVFWIHDFLLELMRKPGGDLGELRAKFEEAFRRVWFRAT
ncbi:MAG: NAD-glutamate dehydrogenase, partial [Pseudomonadales bacterium]|nr:NAD-glutamate dehydrogenase [Pseudomonadales bacterium]